MKTAAFSPPTDRVRVRRLPERGAYDPALIAGILDEAMIAHIGFSLNGQPFVVPVTFVRVGEAVYFHGSAASRALENAAEGVPLCFTVTLLDGLVFARSAFHHSMNYRSVVVLGNATAVKDRARKLEILNQLVNRFSATRADVVRGPSELELKATLLVSLPLTEASAKVRSGPPKDDAEDMGVECWAGVVPLALAAQPPEPDAGISATAAAPALASLLQIR